MPSVHLYAGTTTDFVSEATRNNIAHRLETAFAAHYRYRPSPAEVRSWEQSLSRLSLTVALAKLTDHGIFLEYQLPLTSRRLDAMLTGRDGRSRSNAVIVELKQWQETQECDAEGMVTTWLAGEMRDQLHPSLQARQYRDYLADMHTAFHDGDDAIDLSACAYLHNYRPGADDPIYSGKFDDIRRLAPIFGAGDTPELEEFLVSRLQGGRGLPILQRVQTSTLRPSKKLLDHVAQVVRGEPRFVLLDEQQVVFQRVLAESKRGWADGGKRVLLVEGGPGTGKSVLAANLLGALSRAGLNAQYATGSRAFTETLRRIVGARAAAQFTYFNSYVDVDRDTVDVLICDEAHRIRADSSSRFMKKAKRESMRPQIDELLKAAKVSVFFIDDRQVVRPGETGSAELIRAKARSEGAGLWEYRLEAQFRCAGSDAFVNWVENTLALARTATPVWSQAEETFDVRAYTSPEALDAAIREKAREGASARLVAGFCWPWRDPRADGSLCNDVVIGDFRRPWNAKPDAKRLARNVPKATLWAFDPRGIDQVGCVYTAQGFEFDYVGVIWGRDLRFDYQRQEWTADRSHSHDSVVKRGGDRFVDFVKNTYRVLLSRGLKGCYLYFEDAETAKYVLGRTEGVPIDANQSVAGMSVPPVPAALGSRPPLRVLSRAEQQPYKNSIPVLDLRIAAGTFGEFQMPDYEAVQWVEPPPRVRPAIDLFVAQVVGESMNRRIANGAWCLFRLNPAGTRNGKIVLAQLRDYTDPDAGAAFTIKRYESVKASGEDGTLTNLAIRLKPESTDAGYGVVEVGAEEERVRIVAELLQVLS